MKLIEHIVRNDRPFTEIVTADYIMVTPYTARGYGIFDELKPTVQEPGRSVRIHPGEAQGARRAASKPQDQESATGFYPHAGLLSTFQYLRRYPTTETNRNRLRARMYYQHFLGVDVLELAARVSDAAAVTAKYEIPTMQASRVRRLPQDARSRRRAVPGLLAVRGQGVYGRRKDGWFTDMFGAGFEGEDLPAEERWRALQWLGERTAKDPRFAVAMVEHVYYILTGRKVLLPPKDLDDPLYAAKRRAYQEQRRQIEAIAARFAKTGFNLKSVLQGLDRRPTSTAPTASRPRRRIPQRRAELDDIGLVRMLSPEQVERKVARGLRQAVGPARTTSWRCSTAASTRRKSPSAPPTRAARWARSSASCPTTWRASRRRARLQPPARRAPALPGHRAGRAARRIAGGGRDDPPGDRASARARAGPLRRAGFAGGRAHLRALRRHRRATPRERKGIEQRENYSLPAEDRRRAVRRSATTPSAPGAAWSPTCCASTNSSTSNHHDDATSSNSAAWPASASPCPGGSPRCCARRRRKTPPYDGPYYVVFNASGGWDTTYLMDPKGINGINRLYKEGDILTQGRAQVRPDRQAHARAA